MKVYLHQSGLGIRRHSGAALVITLAMLILVSFVVVAFLGRSTREAVLVGGAVGGQKADLLANSVSELIIADLKNEIRAGSTETIDNGVAIMEPTSAATAFPSQNRLAATTGTAYVNVLKQSGATGGMFTASGTKLISDNTTTKTTTASVDGRTVSAARWNAPRLLVPVTSNFNAAQVPNWILLDRAGIAPSQTWPTPAPPAPHPFTDRTPTNDSYIIGRFAYNIYDVSGLLDINVAGFPSTITAAQSSRKGSMAMVALEKISGIGTAANASTFVRGWRNKLTGNNSTDYLSYIGLSNNTSNSFYNLGPKCGFQKITSNATSSDNRLLSRQDLIRLATNGSNGITTNALPYLTHFSRAVSAPSLSPTTSTAANRFLPNVRVSGDFKRLASGEPAVKGEPLLKYRFPLSRLAGIGRTGVNTSGNTTLDDGDLSEANSTTVQRDFGLVWSGDQWIYAGPTDATALTAIDNLSAISGREPNFFELLKASILSGSLGKSFGNGLGLPTSSPTQTTLDGSPTAPTGADRQIIQIGLNIIDQYDGDSYPTICSFGGQDLYGIENLPYLNRVFMHFYRPPSPGPTPTTPITDPSNVNAYWIGEVWNPHRGTSPAPPSTGPSKFRFSVVGDNQPDAVGITGDSAINSLGVVGPVASAGNIEFSMPTVSEPQILLPTFATSADPLNTIKPGYLGLYAGTVKDIPSGSRPPMTITSPSGLDFILEYEEVAGTWKIYQKWGKIDPATLTDTQGYRGNDNNLSPGSFIQGADPRSTRFGLFGGVLAPASRILSWTAASWNAAALPPANLSVGLPASTASFTYTGTLNLTDLSKNLPASTTLYTDPDDTLRRGDAANSTAATDPLLLGITNTNSRPVILNRPFRSVADLGYAFRDLPFKTLDLFTANSADSGLLDVFCVNESSVSGMTAGVINPNTRHAPVLRALVFNSLKNELPPEDRITSTGNEDLLIANAISSTTSTASVKNPSELATGIVSNNNLSDLASTDEEIKARRESVVRALADVSNTRTWNVMVDLVVQSGRYANAATAVDKFTVDGERRMWVHLAIDRYTGQVIARSTEIVNE
jgi:hypothetical protein